jgi:hypothetical protein
MEDPEYFEILHVENLQRQDVHPLDEAIGFKELLDHGGYDVTALSVRIAKSEAYVYQRLKLNDLIKEAQKLFLGDRIGFGHAVILARLDKKQQKDILANHLFTHQDEPVSVRELSDYVRRYLYLDLGNVPWALDDAELVADAGGCSACPKRTGSNPSLFTDMQHDSLTASSRACARDFVASEPRPISRRLPATIVLRIQDREPDGLTFKYNPRPSQYHPGLRFLSCAATSASRTDPFFFLCPAILFFRPAIRPAKIIGMKVHLVERDCTMFQSKLLIYM